MRALLLLLFLLPSAAYAVNTRFGPIVVSSTSPQQRITLSSATGAITCTNNTTYTCPATGTRGTYLITGTVGQQVQIRCTRNGTLANTAMSLTMDQMTVYVQATQRTCNGLANTIITHTISSAQANNTLYNGGRLTVPNNANINNLRGSPFSTANAGGNAHTIRLIFL